MTARRRFDAASHDRALFTIHAVRLLAESAKDRSNDELANVARAELERGGRADIPDHALDMHTRRGQQLGHGIEHFLTEGARVHPELETRERRWRPSCSPTLAPARRTNSTADGAMAGRAQRAGTRHATAALGRGSGLRRPRVDRSLRRVNADGRPSCSPSSACRPRERM